MSAPRVHIAPAVLTGSIDALAGEDAAAGTLENAVARVIDATRRVFAVTGAGLMLVNRHGALRYVGASDAAARALEDAQEDLGEGPGIDCLVLGDPAESPDIAGDDRWPGVRDRAVPAGVRAVLAVAVRLAGSPVGSLTVYRDGPYDWDASDAEAIHAHADVLEGLLGAAVSARRNDVLVEQLQTALERRVVIERAVGALMERHRVGAVVAFGALRRAARDARRPVADLAAETLAGADPVGGRLPEPAGDPDPDPA